MNDANQGSAVQEQVRAVLRLAVESGRNGHGWDIDAHADRIIADVARWLTTPVPAFDADGEPVIHDTGIRFPTFDASPTPPVKDQFAAGLSNAEQGEGT